MATGYQDNILGGFSISDRATQVLHWASLVWALAAIAALVVCTEFGLLDYKPGGDAYEIIQQQVFGVVFAVAAIAAWRWQVVGGAIAGFAGGALMVFAVRQLEPLYALGMIAAFVVPGVCWVLIALRSRSVLSGSGVLALVAIAAVAGGFVADRAYQDLFGASHPASIADAPPDDGLEWVWSGGVTASSAVVNAKLNDDADRARLAVSESADLREPRFGPGVEVGSERRARLPVAGLKPDTDYYYGIEVDGDLSEASSGTLRTFPRGPSSFTLAVGSCARVGSNGAVFDAIREADPLAFLIAGDFHYANIGDDDPGAFREIYDHTLSRSGQAALYRSAPVAYVWDDHDFGANDADATSPSRPAALSTYRENVPHYGLAGPNAAIYQAFTVGRVRVIVTDARSARSPATDLDNANKTMLGAEQKAWFKQELLEAEKTHEVILWVNSVPWISGATNQDNWGSYATERGELADFIAANDLAGSLVMASGDAHMLAIDDGTNSDYSAAGDASFPILHAAALDRPGSTKGGPYSEGAIPGGGQFGLISVEDDGGDRIDVTLTGLNWEGEELLSHRFSVPARAS